MKAKKFVVATLVAAVTTLNAGSALAGLVDELPPPPLPLGGACGEPICNEIPPAARGN
jgi:hypothetical protein